MRIAESKILITLPSSLKVALDAADQVGLPRSHVLLLDGEVEGHVSIQQLMASSDGYRTSPPWRIPKGTTNKDICGYLNLSSGTTGLPKAVSTSENAVIIWSTDTLLR